jgi:hypothetical protein
VNIVEMTISMHCFMEFLYQTLNPSEITFISPSELCLSIAYKPRLSTYITPIANQRYQKQLAGRLIWKTNPSLSHRWPTTRIYQLHHLGKPLAPAGFAVLASTSTALCNKAL